MSAIVDFFGIAVIIAVVKVVITFAALLGTTIVVVWFERKVIADMQARIGPSRWGPFGLFQTLADGIKLFFKEDFRPQTADKWTYAIAPVAAMVPALLGFAVIPVGDEVTFGDTTVGLVMSDLNVGILYFLAMGSLGVYGIVLAGWASGSKYPLLGSIRSTAQLISYETAMGLSLVPIALVAGSLSTVDIVTAQAGSVGRVTFFDGIPVLEQISAIFRFIPNWYIWSQWPAFVIFFIAGVAETNRAPFDLPEAESELVAGYLTEYAGIRYALFFLGEYVHVVVISAMAVTLFFGGWDGPTFSFLSWLWPVIWFMIKTVAFIYLFIWFRASLPRLRYDRLMWLGWKRLIPAALVWIMVTAVVNTAGVARGVRLGVFIGLFVVVMIFIARGDPRQLKPVSPQSQGRATRGVA
ncbi:MAG: NADH-quinone oxidoreductase subunit H [Actinobacteria bacterium]|nr:NADH-quinone oxidoreductase subunit H [Actinomycetota bacterium]